MLDRPRRIQYVWSTVCLGLFLLLAGAVAMEPGWLVEIDASSERSTRWALHEAGLREVLRAIEAAFTPIPLALATLVLAAALWVKNHRRAAVYAMSVMVAAFIAYRVVKRLIDRVRPDWQHTEWLHDTPSFPSGHASLISAAVTVVVVLTVMLVRRASVRRLVIVAAVTIGIAVCLDRVLLGRHHPTDVVGGMLLGVGLGLLGLALYSPLPRSHAVKAPPLPQAVPSNRTLAVVLNPSKVEDAGQFRAIVDAMAREAGWNYPIWYETTVDDSGTGQAEAAAIEGAELVIVCGGDGTVRQVCAELAGTGIPVGIVPAGTGNLLARNLDIPLYIRAAVDIALTGQDRAIDMVAVSGDGIDDTHFLVMAGLGFDAAIMEGVNEDIKQRVGWLAYVWSALKSLMFPPAKLEISIDGGEWTKHRARTVVVGNVGYLQAGMPLLPDASIDDGQLDVVLLYPQKFLSWLPIVYRVLTKQPRTDETINRMTGREVAIRTSADTPRQLDGDPIGPGSELRMECIHGRLLVRVAR